MPEIPGQIHDLCQSNWPRVFGVVRLNFHHEQVAASGEHGKLVRLRAAYDRHGLLWQFLKAADENQFTFLPVIRVNPFIGGRDHAATSIDSNAVGKEIYSLPVTGLAEAS